MSAAATSRAGKPPTSRNQSYEIARLEARYRVNGLNPRERADLDRRFDRLEMRIAREVRDRDYGQGYGHRR